MPAISEQDGESLGLESRQLPRHIAIIMDGNGRWASRRGFPRIDGHRQGVNSVRTVVEESTRLGIEQLTLYCLSSENWKRPALELNLLMQLLKKFVIGEREEIMRQNIRFTTIGRRTDIPDDVLAEVDRTISESRDNTGMQLCLALNYGSRSEIVDAVKSIVHEVEQGKLKAEEINEDVISSHLYTSGMPDPDLVIRTAGEMRVSNFLLWQISYAELWVTETYWPDFSVNDFWQALRDFAARDRRFGGLKG
ncbi:isoprenyl transferase [Gimesia panareensis]|uniref:Isoprenyl transferase n=1 Tax=Gimesia panareensis TaxID=2527978 RepID=A0A518ABT6_9PLAN|nr:isoprenyl transferase [Gimesia panareensis]QDT29265.1 Decaprenyl diphosphate synthase-like protein [Gimesia panareensis]QDU52173.1 Decaprenyl diphosphate synthase-like protein [Gimesia panareensis]